jgi:hypothetical protein
MSIVPIALPVLIKVWLKLYGSVESRMVRAPRGPARQWSCTPRHAVPGARAPGGRVSSRVALAGSHSSRAGCSRPATRSPTPALRSLSRMLLGVSARIHRRPTACAAAAAACSHRAEARASDGACQAEQPTILRAIWRRGGVGAGSAVLQASRIMGGGALRASKCATMMLPAEALCALAVRWDNTGVRCAAACHQRGMPAGARVLVECDAASSSVARMRINFKNFVFKPTCGASALAARRWASTRRRAARRTGGRCCARVVVCCVFVARVYPQLG